MFVTVPVPVCSITGKNKPFQSGSMFYECAELTGASYEHKVIFTLDSLITIVLLKYIKRYEEVGLKKIIFD